MTISPRRRSPAGRGSAGRALLAHRRVVILTASNARRRRVGIAFGFGEESQQKFRQAARLIVFSCSFLGGFFLARVFRRKECFGGSSKRHAPRGTLKSWKDTKCLGRATRPNLPWHARPCWALSLRFSPFVAASYLPRRLDNSRAAQRVSARFFISHGRHTNAQGVQGIRASRQRPGF